MNLANVRIEYSSREYEARIRRLELELIRAQDFIAMRDTDPEA